MGGFTAVEKFHRTSWLKAQGKRIGEEWAKYPPAAEWVKKTPITLAGGMGLAVDKALQAKAGNPVVPANVKHSTLHQPHVPPVEGQRDTVPNPYTKGVARAAGMKCAQLVDQYVIGNIPLVSSVFGNVIQVAVEKARTARAKEKLNALVAGQGQHDATKETKYRTKLLLQLAENLEEAEKEVRRALGYFHEQIRAGRQDPSCDYVAHLYGFVTYTETRIDELEVLADEVDAYLTALRGAITVGKQKLQALHHGCDAVTDALLDAHSPQVDCGKNCSNHRVAVPVPRPPGPQAH